MYRADDNRYNTMQYRRCGTTGLKLPMVSLGLWHNFGDATRLDTSRAMLRKAFDLGITHFDLANNYGPPPGSAESNFGRIFKEDFKSYRDELIISTKAGYTMWDGPYGDYGSRKYLISSINQSLLRMGLDYVDIFYHHRPDNDTDLEESMMALDQIVRSGKALYVGISNYKSAQAQKAIEILKAQRTPMVITQPNYSMLDRWVEEDGLFDVTEKFGVGNIVFSPLAQGLLTDKYLTGIPEDSRAASSGVFLKPEKITKDLQERLTALNDLAQKRGQSLAQMALSWVLRDKRVTSVLIGASKVSQIEDSVKAIHGTAFSPDELNVINSILK